MAKKGIRYAVFGIYHETTVGTTTTITYTDGKRLSPVAAFNGSPNVASATDYGDDGAVESVNEALGATLSVELTNDDMEKAVRINRRVEIMLVIMIVVILYVI